jgi:hypothetical protein
LHSTGNETLDLAKQTAPDHAGAEVCGVMVLPALMRKVVSRSYLRLG